MPPETISQKPSKFDLLRQCRACMSGKGWPAYARLLYLVAAETSFYEPGVGWRLRDQASVRWLCKEADVLPGNGCPAWRKLFHANWLRLQDGWVILTPEQGRSIPRAQQRSTPRAQALYPKSASALPLEREALYPKSASALSVERGPSPHLYVLKNEEDRRTEGAEGDAAAAVFLIDNEEREACTALESIVTTRPGRLDDSTQHDAIVGEVIAAKRVLESQSLRLTFTQIVLWCWSNAKTLQKNPVSKFRATLRRIIDGSIKASTIERAFAKPAQIVVSKPAAAIEAKPDLRDDPRVQMLSTDDRIRFRSLWLDNNFNAASRMLEKVQVCQ